MPEVSIVIPVFKPNRLYLGQLFISIEQQSFQDYEVVISDDGDDWLLIESLITEKLSSKVKYYVNHGSKGIFTNLNNGIKNSEGKYIQIFCQDDIMLPGLLETNTSVLRDEKIGIAFTHFDSIDQFGSVSSFPRREIKFIPQIIHPSEAVNYFLYFGCIPGNLSPVMVNKSIFERAGLFAESYRYIGDYEFWIRAARFTSFYFNKEKFLLVRNHGGQASRQLGTLERFKELRTVAQHLIENSSLPLNKRSLRYYMHMHLFRSVIIYSIQRLVTLKKLDWRTLRQIFNGKPFTVTTSILAFFQPLPPKCQYLKQIMEINRE